MENYRDKYIQLDQMVKQLYLDSCENTGLVNVKKLKNEKKKNNTFMTENAADSNDTNVEDEHPNLNKPEEIVDINIQKKSHHVYNSTSYDKTNLMVPNTLDS